MTIVSSSYTESDWQLTGSRTITAQFVNDDGQIYGYVCETELDLSYVKAAMLDKVNAELLARAAAADLVQSFRLPLTKFEFRSLFTLAERMAIDAFNQRFETNNNLNDIQKAMIRTGLLDFDAALNIAVPFLDSVKTMIGLYESAGILSAERSAEILAMGA